jgi:clathrin heavy chain
VYDPVSVRDFLLDAKLPDPRPLIHVCDRFGFTEELTSYLYANKLQKFIEVRAASAWCSLPAPVDTWRGLSL